MAQRESSLGFKNFEGYQRSIRTVASRKARYEIVGALNELFFTGESQEKYLKGTALTVYLSLEDRVLKQRIKAFATCKSNDESNDESDSKSANETANESKFDEERRSSSSGSSSKENSKEKPKEEHATDTESTVPELSGYEEIGREPQGFGPFYAHALSAYNRAMGTAFTGFPVEAREGLAEAFRAGHSDADTDAVIAVASSWEPQYRTPNAAFGGGKYEQWLFKGREAVHDHSDINAIFG